MPFPYPLSVLQLAPTVYQELCQQRGVQCEDRSSALKKPASGGFWGSQAQSQVGTLRTVHLEPKDVRVRRGTWGGVIKSTQREVSLRVLTEGMALDSLSLKGAQLLLSWMKLGRRCGGRKVLLVGGSAKQTKSSDTVHGGLVIVSPFCC